MSQKVVKMGRLRKKAAGKARESLGMRRTLAYAAMTKDEAQRSIRPFYEVVKKSSGEWEYRDGGSSRISIVQHA